MVTYWDIYLKLIGQIYKHVYNHIHCAGCANMQVYVTHITQIVCKLFYVMFSMIKFHAISVCIPFCHCL